VLSEREQAKRRIRIIYVRLDWLAQKRRKKRRAARAADTLFAGTLSLIISHAKRRPRLSRILPLTA